MLGAFSKAQNEILQDHSLRVPLLENIKNLRNGRLVISFFISFKSKTPLGPEDADIIEEVLVNSDTRKGVTLILDAPGGDGLSAERIIQLCRKYSKNDFETIVPARAKSAATMVCLGSDRILMGATSELGPIDPQIPMKIGDTWQWMAAHHVIKTYDDLMDKAITLQNGNIDPFLQQLSQFNAIQIQMLRSSKQLAENIAVTSLKRGMMKRLSPSKIKEKIKCFIDPDITLAHGRALSIEHLKPCGLNIEEVDLDSELWKNIHNLYISSTFVVDRKENPCKLLETIDQSYQTG